MCVGGTVQNNECVCPSGMREQLQQMANMTYVQAPSGYILELVSTVVQPMFERWWAGGDLA